MTERGRYHNHRSSLWLWRALILAISAIIATIDKELFWLLPFTAGLSSLFLLWSFIHTTLQAHCSAENDCGDKHVN